MTTTAAQMKEFYARHPGYAAERQREYRREHPERVRESNSRYRASHRAEVNATHLSWKQRNPDRAHAHAIKSKFGITAEQYAAMLSAQGGTCALCGKTPKRRLCVDHDHKTGRVRALLCTPCNVFVGRAERDPEWFARVMAFLHDGRA